jgi:Tol biopolymer transport system component
LPKEGTAAACSPVANACAILDLGEDDRYEIFISSPPGTSLKKYAPDPFSAKTILNRPRLGFSPNGKQILLLMNDAGDTAAWLLPYPADASHAPHRVLETLASLDTPQFGWMPDNRHVVLSLDRGVGASQLWMADTRSEEHYALTSGTEARLMPKVSPDGSKLLYLGTSAKSDVVSIDPATATVHPLIATGRSQGMPAWAARQPVLAFVTNRNGPAEIWLHGPGDTDRPLISPPSPRAWLMGPAPSPDAGRVIYSLFEPDAGGTHLWMAATTGGSPIRLTNEDKAFEGPGSWSPDGAWFVFVGLENSRTLLKKVKTSGQATPVVMKENIDNLVPAWSPDGKWIAYQDHGLKLISPDSKDSRDLGTSNADALGFSADSKFLYGMRPEGGRALLFSIEISNGKERVIGDAGKENGPKSALTPATRLSLAPDGKSFTYSTRVLRDDLWMLEGFANQRGLLARLGLR